VKSKFQVIKTFLNENKLRIIVVMIFFLIFLIANIFLQRIYNTKEFSNEDYIFTKDYLNIENDVARLPYINIKSKSAKEANVTISDYFYNVTSSKNTLLDYEISEEKNNLTLNIFTKKINSNKKNNDITCQINTKSRKVKCIY
jgi:hypothetical protein